MAKISKLKQVQDRRKEVSRKILELRNKIDELSKEEGELEIAARVLERLNDDSDTISGAESPALTQDVVLKQDTAAKVYAPRPEGAPTTFEMVIDVLRGAKDEGQNRLEASDIVAKIEKKFWPGVDPNSIRPSLHRFAEKRRLIKKGSYYSLPEDKPQEPREDWN